MRNKPSFPGKRSTTLPSSLDPSMPPAIPPRPDLRRSTGDLLRRSYSTFLSSLLPLVLPAFLLLSFRSALLAGTLTLSSLSDRHPSLLSLLASPPSPPPPPLPPSPRRNPNPNPNPFIPPPTDFLSSSPLHHSFPNSSFPRIFLSSSSFPSTSSVIFSFPDRPPAAGSIAGSPDLTPRDAAAFLYLLSILSLAHSLAILGFIFVYSCALGLVFFTVAAAHLGHPVSLLDALCAGASIGLRKLAGFVFLKWSVRDALVQFLCVFFFSEVSDPARLFKLFIKIKLMPFSHGAGAGAGGPWDPDLSGLQFAWTAMDTVLSVLIAVHPWVLVMDQNGRRRGRDPVTEGFYLVSLLPVQAFWINCLETVVCGSFGRWTAMAVGGKVFARLLHATAEVYFMVVWLVFYFAARSKDAELEGQRFGREDLEDCLSGIT